jgi:hypothetical protein
LDFLGHFTYSHDHFISIGDKNQTRINEKSLLIEMQKKEVALQEENFLYNQKAEGPDPSQITR